MPSEYENAIHGRELYNYFGNRVVESKTTNGQLVAVKVKPLGGFVKSEADMMNYASQQQGILEPRVLGCYDVEPEIKEQQDSIKNPAQKTIASFPELHTAVHWTYKPEEFDNWYLARVKSPVARAMWKRLLPRMRGTGREPSSKQFVLTHGDLAARNIMVDNESGRITEIVDWEYSGFFPEYMEYALATEYIIVMRIGGGLFSRRFLSLMHVGARDLGLLLPLRIGGGEGH